MILEGIVTTRAKNGDINIAPMGPEVEGPHPQQLVLKPFETSETFKNLSHHGEGVFHVVDNVLVLVQAMLGIARPSLQPASVVQGSRLVDCCRAFEFRVVRTEHTGPRGRFIGEVVAEHTVRDFFGFNRAKHAVLEAAILVSRLGILPTDQIARELLSLEVIVQKTGGFPEKEAFDLLAEACRKYQSRDRSNDRLHDRSKTFVRVRAPGRLHFGFLATPHDHERAWGGIGLMIDSPAMEVIARPACSSVGARAYVRSDQGSDVSSSVVARAHDLLHQLASILAIPASELPDIEVAASPQEHVGLGVGTQLTLSIAEAVARYAGRPGFYDEPVDDPTHQSRLLAIARRLGRGRRSAIGLHGFLRGGLLVDAGRSADASLTTPPLCLTPPPWGVVIQPPLPPGRHGLDEESAIARAVHLPQDTTRELADWTLREIIPLALEGRGRMLGLALSRYNRRVGEAFASVQGGPFAHPSLEEIVNELFSLGFGASQSSWGPTMFVPVDTKEEAQAVATFLVQRFSLPDRAIVITSTAQTGASVTREVEGEP